MNPSEAKPILEDELVRLEASRAALLAEERAGHPDARAEASPQDSSEIGEQLAARRDAISEIDVLDDLLADVRAALGRVEAGTYGICIDCGQPIAAERLRAMPTALRCVRDQERVGSAPLSSPPRTV